MATNNMSINYGGAVITGSTIKNEMNVSSGSDKIDDQLAELQKALKEVQILTNAVVKELEGGKGLGDKKRCQRLREIMGDAASIVTLWGPIAEMISSL